MLPGLLAAGVTQNSIPSRESKAEELAREMAKGRASRSVLVIDPFAGDKGHLLDDDLFWAKCLEPIAEALEIRSSPQSVERIHNRTKVRAKPLPPLKWCARFFRLRLVLMALGLSCNGFDDVFFQSFEEVSALLFMLRHRRTRVHLMVTNNLSLERVERHPLLSRLFLGAVFRRATTVFVHCHFEESLLKREYKRVKPASIMIKPFHQIGFSRTVRSWAERDQVVFFMGPLLECKPIEPVLQLIREDKTRRFRYALCGMSDMDSSVRAFLESQPNVDLRFGHLEDDEYYRRIGSAALVLLSHSDLYQGRLSGIFCDAIASGTAVITRDMAPVNEFFARFGPMGYMCDYGSEAWYSTLLRADLASSYASFQANMARCRASCSIDAIRQVMQSALGRMTQT